MQRIAPKLGYIFTKTHGVASKKTVALISYSNSFSTCHVGGTCWHSCGRHCVTSRKFACSIPDGVIGIFQRFNPSGRSMALGLTRADIFNGALRRTVRTADCLEIWEPQPAGTLRACSGLYRDFFTFLLSCESRRVRGPNVRTGTSDRKIWLGNEGRKTSAAAFRWCLTMARRR